jgi:hypothetical protein
MSSPDSIANTGANLEADFQGFVDKGELNSHNGFEILDIFEYKRGANETYPDIEYPKAIAVRDKDGNVFVHFNGTGDGNWNYNSAAYGGSPSRMQEESLKWFNEMIEKHYEGQSAGNLYVTGHSQGGNNAQFVTIRSQYGDYISDCIALDGPGFSHQFVEESKELLGEAFYESQCNKIWAYNGENDFVSILGQESIVPDGHTKHIEYTNPNNEAMDFEMFHMVKGLLDKNGNIKIVENDSAFRKYVAAALDKVKELPPEQQARAADLVMMLCEDLIEAQEPIKSNMTAQEFDELKEILVPLVVEILADNPESIVPVLQELGIDGAAAESIADLIGHINTYPTEVREQIIAGFLQAVKYENGQLTLDKSNIPVAILKAWPVILETALTHPGDLMTVLNELGVDEAIGKWIKENPWQFAGICLGAIILAPIWMPIARALIVAGLLADAVIRIVQGLTWLAGKAKEAIVALFNAIKNAITAFAQWFRNTFNTGVRYAANNPYFKLDTAKLRNYATRINNVNNRLRNLDSGLRGLYWQVGLLDIWDILMANVLTSGSPTLNQIRSYLNNAADRFETAENKARGYVGG